MVEDQTTGTQQRPATAMRFGIIGTGFISDWFVEACRLTGGIPTGVYSRSLERGREFAARHRLEFVATGVDDLAGDERIDAIYVASPIGTHHAHVRAALARSKHVLCEKTLTTSPDQVRELFDLAGRMGRVLLEAVRPAHDPAYRVIAAALPRLGTLRHAHFEKCQYSSRYPAFLRGEVLNAFEPSSGNSALRDIGVYCLHPALTLFGSPAGFAGTDFCLGNGFEAGGSMLLDYGSMSVTCTYSKVACSATASVIQGENGTMTIDSIAEPAEVRIIGLDGFVEPVLSGPPKRPRDTLHHPIEEFLRLCATTDTHHRHRAQSLAAERIMHAILNGEHEPAPCPSGREDPQW